MRKILLSILLLSSLCLTASADVITVNGTQRDYIVYVPQNLGDNRPLLISCHGANQSADYQKGMLSIETVADTAKFVTVFPNGIGNADGSQRMWDIGGDRDINFIKALIDKMVELYKIDRKRVYLSGFSMGGMLTYHAMNKIPDVIAAFAPISGYPMGGATANASVRAIPIIHTHGTGDDICTYGPVQGNLNVWINHNGCPTTAEVTRNYRGASGITRYTWGPGNDGVEVVLMELQDKGHWISNDWGVKTGDEIWKFCKNYSLELKNPTVRITAPKQTSLTYISMGGSFEVPALTITATADDPDGQVVKVGFYDGSKLLKEQTVAPYTCEVSGLTKGSHTIRVVATDDEGRTGSNRVLINVEEPTGSYLLQKNFTTTNSVPEGWVTYDGTALRTGFSSGYTNGPRVFQFTASERAFEWGLYTRNVNGTAKAGYARFGAKGTNTTLTLHRGNYNLYHKVCNWNCSNFSPVTLAVEDMNGKAIYSETFTPTVNIGNSAANSFGTISLKTSNFDVEEDGQYVITFYTADAAWADLVVGVGSLYRKSAVTAVRAAKTDSRVVRTTYYTMAGLPVQPVRHGSYIEKALLADGSTNSRVVVK